MQDGELQGVEGATGTYKADDNRVDEIMKGYSNQVHCEEQDQ